MGVDPTIREFTRQAGSFEAPGSHFADGAVLGWIADAVPVGDGDRVLDVAGGTGQLGRHLARAARCAIVADVTPAMLERGARATREEGRTDVVFVRADAAALPIADAQFEIVVTRFALHHIGDVAAALAEMRRVAAPGCSVTIVDMVAPEGAAGERLDALRAEAAGGEPTGLRAAVHDGVLAIEHTYLLLGAVVPGRSP